MTTLYDNPPPPWAERDGDARDPERDPETQERDLETQERGEDEDAALVELGGVTRDALSCYLRDMRPYARLLSREEVNALAVRIQAGDLAARETLVLHNHRLAVAVAKRYQHRGLPLMDLIQLGNLGLVTAAQRFDPTRGNTFSTMATWWVRQAVSRGLADLGRLVRLPVKKGETLAQQRRAGEEIDEQLLRAEFIYSLDAPLEAGSDTEVTLMGLVTDPRADTEATALAHLEREEMEAWFRRARLTERERTVLGLRYGLDGLDGLDGSAAGDGEAETCTLAEVGERYGISRERARQIEAAALLKLRRTARSYLTGRGPRQTSPAGVPALRPGVSYTPRQRARHALLTRYQRRVPPRAREALVLAWGLHDGRCWSAEEIRLRWGQRTGGHVAKAIRTGEAKVRQLIAADLAREAAQETQAGEARAAEPATGTGTKQARQRLQNGAPVVDFQSADSEHKASEQIHEHEKAASVAPVAANLKRRAAHSRKSQTQQSKSVVSVPSSVVGAEAPDYPIAHA